MNAEIETHYKEILHKTVTSAVHTLIHIVDESKDPAEKATLLANICIGISTALIYQLAKGCDLNPYEVKQDILNKINRSVDATIEVNMEKPDGDSIH